MQHITQTIETLRESVRRANETIELLNQFQAGLSGLASAPALAAAAPPAGNGSGAGAEEHPAPVRIHQPSPVPQGTGKQGKPNKHAPNSGLSARLFPIVAKLPQPFTPLQLATAAGVARKQAENFIVLRVCKAQFDRTAPGQYQRGRLFPAALPGAPATPPRRLVTPGRKLGERPGLVPKARGDARPTKATPAPAATITAMLNKPESLGQAMKLAVRPLSKFNGEQLREAMLQEAHTQKLFQASAPGLFQTNLTYWTKQGYLLMNGETPLYADFTVTASGKEWFAK